MPKDNELDSLYEDLESNEGANGNTNGQSLLPDDLIDPSNLEGGDDDDYEDYTGDDDLFHESGDHFEPDDLLDDGGDNTSTTTPLIENTIINDLLKGKGIVDPKAIKYENEDGDIEEFDFYELPYEDQLQILQQQEDKSNGLTDHENEVVGFLRKQNATLDDIIEFVKREAIEEYERETSGRAFVVDDYKDEELFLMDLKLNYEDLTEEELQIQLEKELEHEDLFKKKIAKIRSQYIDLEVKERDSKENQKLIKEEEEFETLSTNLIQAAVSLEDIGGINLEDDDKNVIISTILEKDMNGITDFKKRLEDPKILFKAAWFIEKGDEAFNMIHEYYKKQIDTVRKSSYEKGKAESKGTSTSNGKASYTRTGGNDKEPAKKFKSIYDLA